MQKIIILRIITLLMLAIYSGITFGQVPQLINYQGVLINPSTGQPVPDNTYTITFSIYNVASGGSQVWTETQSVPTKSGLYSVLLGSSTPLTTTVFSGAEKYLGIKVGSDPEMTPRKRIVSVAYALISEQALNSWNLTGNSGTSAGSNFLGTTDNQPLIFRTNGSEVMRINTNGNVGIGTTYPLGKLSVQTNNNGLLQFDITTLSVTAEYEPILQLFKNTNPITGSISEIRFQSNTSSGNQYDYVAIEAYIQDATPGSEMGRLQFLTRPSTGGLTTKMVITGEGNVGIGLIAPEQKLDVQGTVQMDGFQLPVGATNGYILTSNASGIGTWQPPTGGGIGGSGTTNYIPKFMSSTSLGNSVIFETNGNIGIGTTTPTSLLDIVGGDAKINELTIGRGSGNISTNSAFGYRALYYNTTGGDNTANGNYALYYNTTGSANTAIGYGALISNTTGYSNTANGTLALNSNTTGVSNTANGMGALFYNTVGFENTAIGMGALYSSTTGSCNTANGCRALYYNTAGTGNTAYGYESLKSNTTGSWNTANGRQSLYSNTTGSTNVANGHQALYSNTTGYRNTANGDYALYSNTTGYCNTAIGNDALYYNSIQGNNTAVGFDAGGYNTCSYGTFLGVSAYSNASDYSNVMGLGYSARPTASNQVRIGNSSITSIGGQVSWTAFSDGRYKLAVTENVKGLDFIMKLRPVTYQLDINKLAADLKEGQRRDEQGNITTESSAIDIKARNEKSQIVYTGFVAQEVEQVAKDIGYDFSGVDAPKNENDFYGLRYAEFVVPLVKAVQEQQKIIEEMQKEIATLKKRLGE